MKTFDSGPWPGAYVRCEDINKFYRAYEGGDFDAAETYLINKVKRVHQIVPRHKVRLFDHRIIEVEFRKI